MPKDKINADSSIYDVVIGYYGNLNSIYEFIIDNQLGSVISEIKGKEVNAPKGITIDYFKPKETVTQTKIVTINSGQTLFDLSLQNYGTIDNVFDLINLNDIDSIISEINKGYINFVEPTNYISNYYLRKGIKIGTKPRSKTPQENIIWDGIFDIWDGTYDLAY